MEPGRQDINLLAAAIRIMASDPASDRKCSAREQLSKFDAHDNGTMLAIRCLQGLQTICSNANHLLLCRLLLLVWCCGAFLAAVWLRC